MQVSVPKPLLPKPITTQLVTLRRSCACSILFHTQPRLLSAIHSRSNLLAAASAAGLPPSLLTVLPFMRTALPFLLEIQPFMGTILTFLVVAAAIVAVIELRNP